MADPLIYVEDADPIWDGDCNVSDCGEPATKIFIFNWYGADSCHFCGGRMKVCATHEAQMRTDMSELR